MKIAFFTETEGSGTVDRNGPNMRTDLAWMCGLKAWHHNIHGGKIPVLKMAGGRG